MKNTTTRSRRDLSIIGSASRHIRRSIAGLMTAILLSYITASYALAAPGDPAPSPAPTLDWHPKAPDALVPTANTVIDTILWVFIVLFAIALLASIVYWWAGHSRGAIMTFIAGAGFVVTGSIGLWMWIFSHFLA